MNRKELARVMAARRGKTIQEAEKWESAMLDAMADALRKGEEVRLVGFGGFAWWMCRQEKDAIRERMQPFRSRRTRRSNLRRAS